MQAALTNTPGMTSADCCRPRTPCSRCTDSGPTSPPRYSVQGDISGCSEAAPGPKSPTLYSVGLQQGSVAGRSALGCLSALLLLHLDC